MSRKTVEYTWDTTKGKIVLSLIVAVFAIGAVVTVLMAGTVISFVVEKVWRVLM
jgi:hypothetical protein